MLAWGYPVVRLGKVFFFCPRVRVAGRSVTIVQCERNIFVNFDDGPRSVAPKGEERSGVGDYDTSPIRDNI